MQLTVGNRKFTESEIRSLEISQRSALMVSELEADTLTAVVEDRTLEVRPLAADGRIVAASGRILASKLSNFAVNSYKYGTKITAVIENLTAKMNVENIKRTGTFVYEIDGISDVGLLMNGVYYGGIYNGSTFKSLVDDIINDIFSYTVDSSLANIPIYGWLPKSTRRDALHSVLFALGAVVKKNNSGAIQILPQSSPTPYTIVEGNIYTGGAVEDIAPATKITVVEHSYFITANDLEGTLYEGEVSAEDIITPKGLHTAGFLVEFSEPMHDLNITSGNIIESGANYAVISQSAAAKLTGKKYSHTKRVLQKSLNSGASPNEYTVDECGLISVMNSENVLQRLIAYYGNSKQYPIEFVYNNQKPGDVVNFINPFGDETSGFIESMDIVASHISKASAVITEGYVPTASGNFYTSTTIITSNSMYTVPDDNKGKIRVVLIGGGQAGYRGQNGEDGSTANIGDSYNAPPGEGGAGGQAGKGGKVYIITISVAAGQQFAVSIGAGGSNGNGGAGGNTTFGNFSSANGQVYVNGFVNNVDGVVYAMPGIDGISGGRGTVYLDEDEPEYATVTWQGSTWVSGDNGPRYAYPNIDATNRYVGGGGTGGGAAVGANGGDGQPGYKDDWIITGGNGGRGANGRAGAAGTTRGSGGNGGFGGGGGGGGGSAVKVGSLSGYSVRVGAAGVGGAGGAGGDGADGVVIVYH